MHVMLQATTEVVVLLRALFPSDILFICSIRRRALDLLYGMCDVSNAKDIVEELLQVHIALQFMFFLLVSQSYFVTCFPEGRNGVICISTVNFEGY